MGVKSREDSDAASGRKMSQNFRKRGGWIALAVALGWGTILFPHARATDAAPQTTEAHGSYEVAEPDGYKSDNYRSPVPKTLRGAASVASTDDAKRLFDTGAVFIDVYPRAPKPPNLPASTIWRDPPHTSIAGAHWLPNVGYGTISAETQAYFTTRLSDLTGGDPTKPVVFFCQRECWMSWNAAKRAMEMGYKTVHWFPDGSDGWADWGFDVAKINPMP